jgi:hypothetical protein
MTEPCHEVLEREKDKLWVTDAELIRRLGVPEKIARETLRMLDRQQNAFPAKEKIWGDRRYWPAVLAYFDRQYAARFARKTNGGGDEKTSTRQYTRIALAPAKRELGSDVASPFRSGARRLHAQKPTLVEG